MANAVKENWWLAICLRIRRPTYGTLFSVLRASKRDQSEAALEGSVRPRSKRTWTIEHPRWIFGDRQTYRWALVCFNSCSCPHCLAEQPLNCRARASRRPSPKNDNAKSTMALLEPGRTSRTSYLRAAQAYMLISMPTGTSTISVLFKPSANSTSTARLPHQNSKATTEGGASLRHSSVQAGLN